VPIRPAGGSGWWQTADDHRREFAGHDARIDAQCKYRSCPAALLQVTSLSQTPCRSGSFAVSCLASSPVHCSGDAEDCNARLRRSRDEKSAVRPNPSLYCSRRLYSSGQVRSFLWGLPRRLRAVSAPSATPSAMHSRHFFALGRTCFRPRPRGGVARLLAATSRCAGPPLARKATCCVSARPHGAACR